MVGKTRVTQEEFDEAVTSNIENFDMEEEEALKAAVEEFGLQGADLTGVATSVESRTAKDKHPLKELTAQLEAVLSEPADLSTALTSLLRYLAGLKAEEREVALAVASQHGTVEHVVKAVGVGGSEPETLDLVLRVLGPLLGVDETRSQFHALDGPVTVVSAATAFQGRGETLEAVGAAVAAAATKSEDNKQAFMAAGVGGLFKGGLASTEIPTGAVKAVSKAVKSLTTADDARPVVSRAFQNSKALAAEGVHLEFVRVLKRGEPPADLAAACCVAVRKLACNDELCAELAEEGAVQLAIQVLRDNAGSAQCAAAACGMLRQMAGKDEVKAEFVGSQGLQLLERVLGAQIQSPACMEQALGLLAGVTLRYPEACASAVEAGLPAAVLQVMEFQQQQWVQRQACMALRNLVARNTEFRPLLLDMGAEDALRRAKASYPQACGDVGSAALRDLGLINYND